MLGESEQRLYTPHVMRPGQLIEKQGLSTPQKEAQVALLKGIINLEQQLFTYGGYVIPETGVYDIGEEALERLRDYKGLGSTEELFPSAAVQIHALERRAPHGGGVRCFAIKPDLASMLAHRNTNGSYGTGYATLDLDKLTLALLETGLQAAGIPTNARAYEAAHAPIIPNFASLAAFTTYHVVRHLHPEITDAPGNKPPQKVQPRRAKKAI